MKVLIISHGHPDYSTGGAEMAAYSLFRALSQEEPENVAFLSWISSKRLKLHAPSEVTRLAPGRNEWLLHASEPDWMYQTTSSRSLLSRAFVRFLREVSPDVVHFHHYMGVGLDAIRVARRVLPEARIVVTLHEFFSICLRDGQMITRPGDRLCNAASPVRCSGCFPEVNRSQLALREIWFKRHFALVDGFISPSHFLKQRYVDWGIPPDRIEVIENAQVATTYSGQSNGSPAAELYRTFAFFGRVDRYKGIEILLRAADIIARRTAIESAPPPPRILVYGTIAAQPADFKEHITDALAGAPDFLEYRGPYDMTQVISLMSSVGWVLVPSIWWENSPVVIEEAFISGRPVICSDIGGMAEKVTDGVNGRHFRARDPDDLARVILEAGASEKEWRNLSRNVRNVPTLAETGAFHGAYYNHVAERRTAGRI